MSSSQPTAVLTDQATTAAAGQASATTQTGWVTADGGRSGRAGAILLAIGVVVGLIGLFPNYQGGGSLASEAFNLVPHLFYLAAWAVGAVLIVRGGTGQRTGVLLATGVSVVTFGLMFSDAGFAMAGGAHLIKSGLVLTLISWVLCAAGSLLAFGRMRKEWPRRLLGREAAVALTLIGAAIGAAITFAPSWDRYLLTNSSGASETITLGNAFSNPGWVIAGNVAVMVAIVAVVAVAAFWRPARLGWALAAGAIIPLVGQALSGIIQINSQTAAAQLGISASQASQAGLTVDSSLTAAYWFFCVFLIVLALGCAWLGTSGDLAWGRPAGPASPWATPASAGSPTFGSPTFGAAAYGTPAPGSPAGVSPAGVSPAPAAGPVPVAGPQDVTDAGTGFNTTGFDSAGLNGTGVNGTASTDDA